MAASDDKLKKVLRLGQLKFFAERLIVPIINAVTEAYEHATEGKVASSAGAHGIRTQKKKLEVYDETNQSWGNAETVGGIQGSVLGAYVGQYVKQISQKVDGLDGVQIEVTLTSSQRYPFNNSIQTVQLPQNRNEKDYSVTVEVLEKTGGGVGDFVVTDKLLNGFKLAYTGAASSVKVNCIVQGGI